MNSKSYNFMNRSRGSSNNNTKSMDGLIVKKNELP